MAFDFDLFVIGAGSGGVRAARMAASFGAKVAVAESNYLGGTCVNVGCVPKKLFVYGSQFGKDTELAKAYGWDLSKNAFHWHTLRDNKTKEIERLNGIYENLLVNAGVSIINGYAKFVDSNTVEVDEQRYTAKYILIATGGWPYIPDFPGKELAIDSNQFFYMDELPKKAIVVGGGYIAVEFAGILNGLGVETTLAYRGPLFLRGFDEGVRQFVKEEIQKKGIDLQFNTNISEIEADGKQFKVTLSNNTEVITDKVVYATGRRPRTENLNLQAAGVIAGDKGEIVVDNNFKTSADSVYAVGDVIDRVALTPVALAEGMCVANRLFNDNAYNVDYELIATAVFSQPNIATVGLTEEEAIERYGQDLEVFESAFKPLKYTLGDVNERTFMKLLVQKSTDKVIGAHMVGPEAGEIIQGVAIAMKAGATKSVFDQTIGIHPTSAEEFVTMRQPVR